MDDPKFTFGTAVPFDTLTQLFLRLTDRYRGDPRPVLIYRSGGQYRSMSYQALAVAVAEAAAGFMEEGVKSGERVVIVAENRPEWIVADLALMLIGAVTVAVFPTLTAKQIEFILNDSSAVTAVVSNQLQLRKIMACFPAVPSLRGVVVMSGRGVDPDPRISMFDQIAEQGRARISADPGFHERMAAAVKPSDLLTLVYTSGTTGTPKGVMLTHRNLVANITAAAASIPFADRDVLLSFLPLSHSYQRMAGYYAPMACGVTIALIDNFDAVAEALTELQPSIMITVPRLFERFHSRTMKRVEELSPLRQKIFRHALAAGLRFTRHRRSGKVPFLVRLDYRIADFLALRNVRERTGGRIRFIVSGGAPLAVHLAEFFEAIGVPIIEGYGMSETSPVISVNRVEDYRFGTVGKPLPGLDVRIAPDGEILVRGDSVMQGYWNNPAATAETIDQDGWLHTGDIGALDAAGFLKITDRKKHLFVTSGGKNIAPQPIEQLFTESDYIDQFVLLGDGRMYLTALLVPNFELLRQYALHHDIRFSGDDELAELPIVRKLFDREIARIQQDLPGYERVRKYTILHKQLTIDDGEITPVLKVRRKVVEEKYRRIIDAMYQGAD